MVEDKEKIIESNLVEDFENFEDVKVIDVFFIIIFILIL